MLANRDIKYYKEDRMFDSYSNAAEYLSDLSKRIKSTNNYDGIKVNCRFDDVIFQYSYQFKEYKTLTEKDMLKANMPKMLYEVFIGHQVYPGRHELNGKDVGYKRSKLVYSYKYAVKAIPIIEQMQLFDKELVSHGLPYVNATSVKPSKNNATPATKIPTQVKQLPKEAEKSAFVFSGNTNLTFAKTHKSVSITVEDGQIKRTENGPSSTFSLTRK